MQLGYKFTPSLFHPMKNINFMTVGVEWGTYITPASHIWSSITIYTYIASILQASVTTFSMATHNVMYNY